MLDHLAVLKGMAQGAPATLTRYSASLVLERVRIDSYVKMIDRNPDDNLRRITPQPGPG
ncbi:MAG: hypothetical protein RIB46_12350 [Pseudomonadales bacterium]